MTHNTTNITSTTTTDVDELWAAYERQLQEWTRLRLRWSELLDRELSAWGEYLQASARRHELYEQAMRASEQELAVLRAVADPMAG